MKIQIWIQFGSGPHTRAKRCISLKKEVLSTLGELKFLDGKQFAKARAGLFTFSDGQPWRQTLESYDPEIKLSAYSRMTAYSSWAVFDFPLVGYDPELKQKDPILVFKLTSIEKQSISLKSAGSLQLQTALENGEEAHPGFTWSAGSVLDSARKGYAAYKTVDSFNGSPTTGMTGRGKT